MAITPSKKSKLEETLALCLRADGIEFEREFLFDLPRTRRRADFFIKPNIIVECEGVVFGGKGAHNSAVGVAKDCARNNDLVRLGYVLLRVTNMRRGGSAEPAAVSLLVKEILARGG